MLRYPTLAGALIAIAATAFPTGLTAATTARPGRLPIGWEIRGSYNAAPADIAPISAKLGGKISALSNTILSVRGRRLQVNIINCPDPNETEKIYKSVLEIKKDPAFCLKLGNAVVEFIADDAALAVMGAFELGFKPKPKQATYKVSFQVAPIENSDYTAWSKMLELFIKAAASPGNLALKSRLDNVAGQFSFGNDITLRTSGAPQAGPSYSLKPDPAATKPLADGEITKYTFRNLPVKLDVPYVTIVATITTTESAGTPAKRKIGPDLIAPTKFWPSDDPAIIKLAEKITADSNTPQEKVDAILKWLRPGVNIRFPGESLASSRYGAKKVIDQKFGMSWDFSDCFVTLCRSLNIPCRQVAGWYYGQTGHIWAEFLDEKNQWQQVDPTGGGYFTCGIYHIPYITSEDGEMPIAYLSKPEIELLDY